MAFGKRTVFLTEEYYTPAVGLSGLCGHVRVAFRRDRLLPSDHSGSDMIAKKLNDMNALAMALAWAAGLAAKERNPAEVERLASDLIELSTRKNFVHWLAIGAIYRGWARSASGNTAEVIAWIEQGIRDYREPERY